MESHVAAPIAAAHGLPFAVLRVVCDPAERSLPPAALAAMREDGGRISAVLSSLMRSPGQFPDLLRLSRDARLAFGELRRCRVTLGPAFALP